MFSQLWVPTGCLPVSGLAGAGSRRSRRHDHTADNGASGQRQRNAGHRSCSPWSWHQAPTLLVSFSHPLRNDKLAGMRVHTTLFILAQQTVSPKIVCMLTILQYNIYPAILPNCTTRSICFCRLASQLALSAAERAMTWKDLLAWLI